VHYVTLPVARTRDSGARDLNEEGNNVADDEDSSETGYWDAVDVCYSGRENAQAEAGY
jgi:hypothetical protein